MIYKFTLNTLASLQAAFAVAKPVREKPRGNVYRNWDYLFLQFAKPITLVQGENINPQWDLVDTIFAGDAEISDRYKQHFGENTRLEAGIRWVGSTGSERIIQATGFAFKLSYPSHEPSPLNRKSLVSLLTKAEFIESKEEGLTALSDGIDLEPATKELQINSYCFFNKCSLVDSNQNKSAAELLKKIDVIKPRYRREGETGINPAYQPIDLIENPLALNQKLIWLLRSDGVLATGVKNAYWISFGDNELADRLPESSHQFINWDDRSGHPSLAIPEFDYDGSALYGGYICQKENHLQVFTSSGRYYRGDLTIRQKKLLEAYVGLQLLKKFGEQEIIFYEGPYKDFYELSLFFANKPLPENVVVRSYKAAQIHEILEPAPISQLFSNEGMFENYVEALRAGDGVERFWGRREVVC